MLYKNDNTFYAEYISLLANTGKPTMGCGFDSLNHFKFKTEVEFKDMFKILVEFVDKLDKGIREKSYLFTDGNSCYIGKSKTLGKDSFKINDNKSINICINLKRTDKETRNKAYYITVKSDKEPNMYIIQCFKGRA